jgi:hypothetical protein
VEGFGGRLRLLCGARPEGLRRAVASDGSWLAFTLVVIVAGSGAYGATIGLGRAPLQAAYAAVKFPLLILLTTAGNALLNGMLAQMLGLGISFRQSALAVGTSFALASVVLAALAPVTLFLWWSTPPFSSAQALVAHNATLVVHVALIAGVTGNAALLRLLVALSGSRARAGRILAAWLVGNLFLGSQLSWIMRPFVGSPALPIEFLRADALRGNFYEATWRAVANLLR